MGDWPNDGKLSALNIRRACDASLRRLQTDYIDLYQMHHVDRATPWDEIWQAMEVLVGQGKILYVGSSNFAGWHIAQAQEAARRAGTSSGWSPSSRIYNLLTRDIEREVVPAARDVRARHHPVVAAARRPARRRPAQGAARASVGPRAGPRTALERAPRADRGVRGAVRRARRGAGRGRRWRGCCTRPGGDRADHRPAHASSSSTARCARSSSRSSDDGARPARRDLPGLPDRARGLRLVTLLRARHPLYRSCRTLSVVGHRVG